MATKLRRTETQKKEKHFYISHKTQLTDGDVNNNIKTR